MSEEELIRGPIFGWPYPILNAVLRFLDLLRQRREKRISGRQSESPGRVLAENIDRITWVDWKGRKRETVIHREVR